MADFPQKTFADWAALASKELGGKSADTLAWQTAEGIAVKPLYTAADLAEIETTSLPGFPPFTRGVRATMYAGRPWTLAPICRLLDRRGIERLLSRESAPGSEGALGRFRSRDPSRL